MKIYSSDKTSSYEILKYHVDSKSDPYFKIYKEFHPGLDIATEYVYSDCPGVVVYSSQEMDNTYSVVVMYNNTNCMMYKHLKDVTVPRGYNVEYKELLGTAKKFVNVTHLTTDTNSWPVHICNLTLYKNDPTNVLENGYECMINNIAMQAKFVYPFVES